MAEWAYAVLTFNKSVANRSPSFWRHPACIRFQDRVYYRGLSCRFRNAFQPAGRLDRENRRPGIKPGFQLSNRLSLRFGLVSFSEGSPRPRHFRHKNSGPEYRIATRLLDAPTAGTRQRSPTFPTLAFRTLCLKLVY